MDKPQNISGVFLLRIMVEYYSGVDTKEGLGVALLPDLRVAEEIEAGSLVRLCELLLPEPTSIYAVHTYGTLAPKSVQETIGAIRTVLNEHAM